MIEEVIKRLMDRVKNNDFPKNPYYKSGWEERKEVLSKANELKLIKK